MDDKSQAEKKFIIGFGSLPVPSCNLIYFFLLRQCFDP